MRFELIFKFSQNISFQTFPKSRINREYKSLFSFGLNSINNFINKNRNSTLNMTSNPNNGSNPDRYHQNGWTNGLVFNGYQIASNPSTSQSSSGFAEDPDINNFSYGFPQNGCQQYCQQYYQLNPFFNNLYPYIYPNAVQYTYYNPNLTRNHSSQWNPHLSKDQIERMVKKFRNWEITNDYKEKNSTKFSIMTYNILSQDLLENHQYLYRKCDPSDLSWPERGRRIAKELENSKADIICLQEVHSDYFFETVMPFLENKGYSIIYKKKTGDKSDGCAIVYKKDKFLVQNTVKLEFYQKEMSQILDRDNIAVIAEFKPLNLTDSDTKLIVANTHLLFNPKRGDVKVAQIRLLLAEIDKIALKSNVDSNLDHQPIILCGDMNSEPNSILYNFIRHNKVSLKGSKCGDISGQREGRGVGRNLEEIHLLMKGLTHESRFDERSIEIKNEEMVISHPFELHSVYPFHDRDNNKFISSSVDKDSALVDYIFYERKSKRLKLLGYQNLLTDQQVKQVGNLPNAYLGSDHLSLKAQFRLK